MRLFTTHRKNFDFAFYVICKLLRIVIIVLEGYRVKRGAGKPNSSSSALRYFIREYLEKDQTTITNFIHVISNPNLKFFITRIKDISEHSFSLENTDLSISRPAGTVALLPVAARVVVGETAAEILIAFIRLTIISRGTRVNVLSRLTALEFTVN